MSSFAGRMALSVFRKFAHPMTQDGQHIVMEKYDDIAKEFHLCILAVADEEAARDYASRLQEAEAAVSRGETPPETPVPEGTVEPDSMQRVVVARSILTKIVAQRHVDEIPPGYYNGWRDFLSADAVPKPFPEPESDSEEGDEEWVFGLDGKPVVDAVVATDDGLAYIENGQIIVAPDGTVSIIDESDDREYLVDAEIAARYVVPSHDPMVPVIDLGELFESHPECAHMIKFLCSLPRSRELIPEGHLVVVDELREFVSAFDPRYGLSLRIASASQADTYESAVVAIVRELSKQITGEQLRVMIGSAHELSPAELAFALSVSLPPASESPDRVATVAVAEGRAPVAAPAPPEPLPVPQRAAVSARPRVRLEHSSSLSRRVARLQSYDDEPDPTPAPTAARVPTTAPRRATAPPPARRAPAPAAAPAAAPPAPAPPEAGGAPVRQKAPQPLADAFLAKAVSDAEAARFLAESLPITEPSGRAAVLKTDYMKSGALQRFLKKAGCSEASLGEHEDGVCSEELMDWLLELSDPLNQPVASPPAAAAPQPVTKVYVDSGVDVSGTPEEQKVRACLIRQATNLTDEQKTKLERYSSVAINEDYVTLQELFENEKDSTLISLANIDVPHPAKTLNGKADAHLITCLIALRDALDNRMTACMFPEKNIETIDQKIISALNSVRKGTLNTTNLCHLIGVEKPFVKKEPFKGFASLPNPESSLRSAIDRLATASLYAFPAQSSDALAFYRALQDALFKQLERGVPYVVLGKYYYDIMTLVSAPVKKHLTGSADARALVTFDIAFITDRRSEHRADFDEALEDWRYNKSTALPASPAPRQPRQQPRTPSTAPSPAPAKAPAPATAPSSSTAAHMASKLEVQKKVMAEVPKVDGKSPCFNYFINGSCKDGANCKFHHQGRAAGYKTN